MLSNAQEVKAFEWYDNLDPETQEALISQWIRKHYEEKILDAQDEGGGA